MFTKFSLLATALALAMVSVHAQSSTTLLTVPPSANTPQSPSSSFDSSLFDSVTVTDSGAVGDFSSTDIIFPATESTFPPTLTSCFITPTGSYPMTTEVLDPQASDLPNGAECFLVIRQSGGNVEEELLYTVATDGATISFDSLGVAHTLAPSSSSTATSNTSSKHTGTIVGAVIGSIFGTLFVGATLLWIRRHRRSNRPSATWFNRPAGWVQDEKPGPQIEMTRRVGA